MGQWLSVFLVFSANNHLTHFATVVFAMDRSTIALFGSYAGSSSGSSQYGVMDEQTLRLSRGHHGSPAYPYSSSSPSPMAGLDDSGLYGMLVEDGHQAPSASTAEGDGGSTASPPPSYTDDGGPPVMNYDRMDCTQPDLPAGVNYGAFFEDAHPPDTSTQTEDGSDRHHVVAGCPSYSSFVMYAHSSDDSSVSPPARPSGAPPSGPEIPAKDGMSLLQRQDLFYMKNQSGINVDITDEWRRTWSQKYRELLEMPECELKFRYLGQLAKDFNYAAQIYASIIINEICIPVENKTIKPVDIGGVAGGTKYIVAGILFKFALDFEGLYGSDEAAMKAACHELRGLIKINDLALPGLNTPLMCLVDYKGFRLIAVSLLEIGKDSLKYGSADGGATVHDDVPQLTALMNKAGQLLNLKPHKVGKQTLVTCGDIEVHQTGDGQFYVLDAARLFPPEAALPSHRTHERGEWLYHLLRPELVRKYPKPLSSDAFSMFQRFDRNLMIHNDEVREATAHLFEEVIPAFCDRLNGMEKYDVKDENFDLVAELHRAGINIRHIGLVRSRCTSKYVRRFLLTEMIVRGVKSLLRRQFRRIMVGECRVPREQPFKHLVMRVLNDLWANEDPTGSAVFWALLEDVIVAKFEGALAAEPPGSTLRGGVKLHHLLKRLLAVMPELSLSPSIHEMMDKKEAIKGLVWLESDIMDMKARIRQMHITYVAEGKAMMFKATRLEGTSGGERAQAMIQQSFENAVRVDSSSTGVLVQWGIALYRQLKNASQSPDSYVSDDKAKARLRAALRQDPMCLEALVYYGALKAFGAYDSHRWACSAAKKWVKALAIDGDALHHFLSMAVLLHTPGSGAAHATTRDVGSYLQTFGCHETLRPLLKAAVDEMAHTHQRDGHPPMHFPWKVDLGACNMEEEVFLQLISLGIFRVTIKMDLRDNSSLATPAVLRALSLNCPALEDLSITRVDIKTDEFVSLQRSFMSKDEENSSATCSEDVDSDSSTPTPKPVSSTPTHRDDEDIHHDVGGDGEGDGGGDEEGDGGGDEGGDEGGDGGGDEDDWDKIPIACVTPPDTLKRLRLSFSPSDLPMILPHSRDVCVSLDPCTSLGYGLSGVHAYHGWMIGQYRRKLRIWRLSASLSLVDRKKYAHKLVWEKDIAAMEYMGDLMFVALDEHGICVYDLKPLCSDDAEAPTLLTTWTDGWQGKRDVRRLMASPMGLVAVHNSGWTFYPIGCCVEPYSDESKVHVEVNEYTYAVDEYNEEVVVFKRRNKMVKRYLPDAVGTIDTTWGMEHVRTKSIPHRKFQTPDVGPDIEAIAVLRNRLILCGERLSDIRPALISVVDSNKTNELICQISTDAQRITPEDVLAHDGVVYAKRGRGIAPAAFEADTGECIQVFSTDAWDEPDMLSLVCGVVVTSEGRNNWLTHYAPSDVHWAAVAGSAHDVRLLCGIHPTDVPKTDYKGYTPLHHAACRGDEDVVVALIECGGDTSARSHGGKRPADLCQIAIDRMERCGRLEEARMYKDCMAHLS